MDPMKSLRAKLALAERLSTLRLELFGERGGPEMARRLGIPVRTWYNYEGGVADICVFDAAAEWQLTPDMLRSAGKHTPFDAASSGTRMPGRVRHTLVAGTLAYSASEARPA